jgi:hypothetical protein
MAAENRREPWFGQSPRVFEVYWKHSQGELCNFVLAILRDDLRVEVRFTAVSFANAASGKVDSFVCMRKSSTSCIKRDIPRPCMQRMS